MDGATITTIIISAFGGLILCMWGLLKGMVSNRLDRMDKRFDSVESKQDEMRDEMHAIDKRVLRIETEHASACRFERVN